MFSSFVQLKNSDDDAQSVAIRAAANVTAVFSIQTQLHSLSGAIAIIHFNGI